MKKSVVTGLNVIALIASLVWLYQSGGWEPLIVSATLLATIITKPFETNTKNETATEEVPEGVSFLTGIVDLNEINGWDKDVYYEKPFVRKPRLETRLATGSNNYRITEERVDGFKIRKGGASSMVNNSGINLEWKAIGELV